jgi:SWI/SNF-related matrix-associated actin-dependent regulator of chromatin subfamily A-like protein 1
MQIKILNDYQIVFYKPKFSEDEILLAKCLEMTYNEDKGVVVCDIRITYKKSLGGFIKKVFITQMYKDPMFFKELFANLSKMYKSNYDSFTNMYSSRLSYENIGKKMRNYQIETIYRCIHTKSKLLALSMGTGKTLTSSTLSRIIGAKRTLIICPNIAKWNWFEDMTKEWGYNDLYWTILEATFTKSMTAIKERFVVVNYENLVKYDSIINKYPFDHIILDEAHNVKNTSTEKHKNCFNIIKKNPNAKVTFLSGTPWTNRVTDLFAYLRLGGHPLGKNKKFFEDNYAVKNGAKIIGTKNIEDLNLKISNFMIRLKSEDVLELPALSIIKTYFNMGDLKSEYNEVIQQMQEMRKEYESTTDTEAKKDFKFASKIRQSISQLSRITAMSKIPSVVDLVKSMNEQNEKVVIFSSWRGVLEELEKSFKDSSVRIDGSVEASKRQVLVNKFKDSPNCTVFLGQVKAAGVAINLVNARNVILMDIPVSPDLIEQPIKRVHRSGQKKPVNAYFTFAKGTIDERIYSLIVEKAGDINRVIDADTKNGVVEYEKIPEMLFKELTN